VRRVMDVMLVTGSPAAGRKEVWVERCAWADCVGRTNSSSQRSVVDTWDEVARDGAKDRVGGERDPASHMTIFAARSPPVISICRRNS
jgi:hypothetical protein